MDVHPRGVSEPAAPVARLPAMRTISRLAAGIAVAFIAIAAAGCSMVGSSTVLKDRTFLSVSVTDGGAARPLVGGTRVRLDFHGTDVAASAGCNSMGGTYRVEGGKLVFDAGAMTEMGCDPDRMAQDAWLVGFLGSKPAVQLTADELTLQSGSIVMRLLDRKVVEPDVPLTGHAWTVVSIIAGDAVSSVPGDAVATVTFNADGTLTVFAGCNQGGASWKAIGPGVEVSALVMTKKACEGAGGQLESAVVAVLRAGSIGASIDADVLTLQAGGSGLQLRAS